MRTLYFVEGFWPAIGGVESVSASLLPLLAQRRRGLGELRQTGEVGAWRRHLSRSHELLIRGVAGAQMAAKGYLDTPGLAHTAWRAGRRIRQALN